jgi:HSP90 family molecular chaperone
VLHTPDGQPTAQMTRMMKAMGQEIPTTKKKLIINAESKLVQKYMSDYDT